MSKMWRRFQKWRAARMMAFVAKHNPDALHNFILERAAQMSVGLAMDHMARAGAITCAMCLRRAPLRKIDDRYYCPKHVEAAVKARGIPAREK